MLGALCLAVVVMACMEAYARGYAAGVLSATAASAAATARGCNPAMRSPSQAFQAPFCLIATTNASSAEPQVGNQTIADHEEMSSQHVSL